MYYPETNQSISLFQAIRTLHRDRLWWRKLLLNGTLAMTLIGYPFAEGLLIESADNTRRGFPTPLPPWRDPGMRYVLGIFGLLIDIIYYVLPGMICGLILICIGIATLLFQVISLAGWIFPLVIGLFALQCVLIACSSAPTVARLDYVSEGKIEDAIGFQALRASTARGARGIYFRARLASLPAYLPAIIFAVTAFLIGAFSFPGSLLLILLLVWLMTCAWLYARLVEVQIYVAAERAVLRQRTSSSP